jgi:hypothetical protein
VLTGVRHGFICLQLTSPLVHVSPFPLNFDSTLQQSGAGLLFLAQVTGTPLVVQWRVHVSLPLLVSLCACVCVWKVLLTLAGWQQLRPRPSDTLQ